MKEHTCKFKRKKPTQSRSLEQHMTLAKVSLYYILKPDGCETNVAAWNQLAHYLGILLKRWFVHSAIERIAKCNAQLCT